MNSSLRQLVLGQLGFDSQPSVNLEGLRAVYRTWCANVPFDNVRKMIALRSTPRNPLPGAYADSFFEAWISHGAGETCWPTSNALFELLDSVGFAASRITGCMRDLGIVNHASVKVALEGREWLVDSSALSNVPLPLTNEVFISDDPVFAAEVEPYDSTHLMWIHTPPNSSALPCRLNHDVATHAFYLSKYEESRACSPFNQRPYARRNGPAEMVVLLANTRFSKTAEGVVSRDLSPDEVCEALHRDIALSEDLIDDWVRSGSLSDSFQPSSAPKPPSVTRKPPSQREPVAAAPLHSQRRSDALQ
jgi:arylamine N-acetyltransferase